MNKGRLNYDRQYGSWIGKAGDDTLTVHGTTLVRTDRFGKVKTVTLFETTRQAVEWTENNCL